MNETNIEWATNTWNPILGCDKVSPGCAHCYAITQANRWKNHKTEYTGLVTLDSQGRPQWSGNIGFFPQRLVEPMKRKKARRIFVCSMSDLFHESVTVDWIDAVFGIMALCPQHTFMVLTKRPWRMRGYLDYRRSLSDPFPGAARACVDVAARILDLDQDTKRHLVDQTWPPRNVWLGTSVEDQKRADYRISILLGCPGQLHFISAEPLLGPLTVRSYLRRSDMPNVFHPKGLDWVIAGGESGRRARPVAGKWFRSLRDECVAAEVPFYFKQWGEWTTATDEILLGLHKEKQLKVTDGELVVRLGRRVTGRELDGRTWDQFPGGAAWLK